MATLGWSFFMLFLIFEGILEKQFDLPRIYSYWDEAFFLGAMLTYFLGAIKINHGKLSLKKEHLNFILPWILLVAVGLLGNYFFHYVSYREAILRDIVGFLKFPLTFYVFRNLEWDRGIAKSLQKQGLTWLKWCAVIIFICGILSQFYGWGGMLQQSVRSNISPYQFLFNHPTALVFASVVMLCLFCADEGRKKYFVYTVMLMLTIVLTMRTKGIAFVVVYIFMRYGSSWLKKYKILYLFGIVLLAFVAGYSKLQLYASWSSSGREVLWIGSLTLVKMCFPIGSGFGTYASHLSGKYSSQIYDFINSSDFWTWNGEATSALGDTGFPYYIGQFGFIGLILLGIAVLRFLRIWHSRQEEMIYRGLAEDLLLVYIAIALTSEATLITYGYQLAVVLSVLIKLDAKPKHDKVISNAEVMP